MSNTVHLYRSVSVSVSACLCLCVCVCVRARTLARAHAFVCVRSCAQATASVYLTISALLWLTTLLSWVVWHRTYRSSLDASEARSSSSGSNDDVSKAWMHGRLDPKTYTPRLYQGWEQYYT